MHCYHKKRKEKKNNKKTHSQSSSVQPEQSQRLSKSGHFLYRHASVEGEADVDDDDMVVGFASVIFLGGPVMVIVMAGSAATL